MSRNRRGRSAGPPSYADAALTSTPAPALASASTSASAPAPAPAPTPAPNPSSTASTSNPDNSGSSVSTSDYTLITTGSPHSHRPAVDAIDERPSHASITTSDQRHGAIDFSAHPEFDISDASDDGTNHAPSGGDLRPTTTGEDITPGGGTHTTSSADDEGDPTSTTEPDFATMFAQLALLRAMASAIQAQANSTQAHANDIQAQANSIQAQLDSQCQITMGLSTSVTNINHSLDTLRDASKSNSEMALRAISIADDSVKLLEQVRSETSGFSYKLHQVTTKVDDLITQRPPTSTPSSEPPTSSSTIDDAFAETVAALSSSLNSMEQEIGSRLDRNIAARSSSADVRFSGVTDIWSNRPPRCLGPTSPRHRLALTRGLGDDILAWHAGEPGGDCITGRDFMEDPDVEALGVPSELAVTVAEDHFDIVQNWVNPRWMQRDVRDFNANEDGYTAPSTGGPNITDILKQINSWDKLSDLSPTGWHAFYNKLRRFSLKWKISLMPFGAVNLRYQCQGHALCICGLGLVRYRSMGDALFLILEHLLPVSNPIIATTLDSLATLSSTANGYTLLWTLLREFIPMLDNTTPTAFPTWPESDDIFQYARLVLMYCDLAQHRGPPYTDAMKSRLFLTTVRGRYASMASQFTAMIGTYCPGRDGAIHCLDPLPNHLSVMELARLFYDEATRSDAILPAAFTPPITITHSVHANRTTAPPDASTPVQCSRCNSIEPP